MANSLIDNVKLAIGLTDSTYNSEISMLVESAKTDLGIGNVDSIDTTDEMTKTAIILFCSYQFQLMHGAIDRSNALKECYDSIKSQMGGSSLYRNWGELNG